MQAARCWFKEYIKIVTLKVGFKQCKNYPSILYRVNETGTAIVIVYVYDTLEIRDKPALMDTIECIKKEYANQSMGKLEDFIGCTIKRDLTNMTLNIYQPNLIYNMNPGCNKDVKLLMTFNTPDTPHKGIVRNQETDTKISYDLQNRYRSGIRLLLYLVKHSQPKLSNVVREISQCMDEANMSQYKALMHAIKYAIGTKVY